MPSSTNYKLHHPQSYIGLDQYKTQTEKKLLNRGFEFNLMVVGQSGLGKTTFVNTLFAGKIMNRQESKDGKNVSVESLGSKDLEGSQFLDTNQTAVNPQSYDEESNVQNSSSGFNSSNAAAASQSKSYRSTAKPRVHSFLIEENSMKMKLNLIDTPGFADGINNEQCWEPITRYIKDQYAVYLKNELAPNRQASLMRAYLNGSGAGSGAGNLQLQQQDTRVHCCLYFFQPSGHSLKPIDIICMKKLGELVNVIPCIGKADSLTTDELAKFKHRVREELMFHNIRVFPPPSTGESMVSKGLQSNFKGSIGDLSSHHQQIWDSLLTAEEQALNNQVRQIMPYALVGSEDIQQVDGKPCRVRRLKWGGIVNVDNPDHCDFTRLRDFLIRSHLAMLLETTSFVNYEQFRTRQLLALKESAAFQQQQNQSQDLGSGNHMQAV